MANQCRNTLICFACNRSGHRARDCSEVQSDDKVEKKESNSKQIRSRVPIQPQSEKEEMGERPRVKSFVSSTYSNDLDDHFEQSFILIEKVGVKLGLKQL